MIIIAVLWYGYEELIYWIWWAISGKELDFYEKISWAQRVFWIVIISLVMGIIL